MANATVSLTIDLAAFQKSLTASFSMFNTTIKAMGQQGPEALKQLEKDLENIASKAAKPIILNADGTPMVNALSAAETSVEALGEAVDKSAIKSETCGNNHPDLTPYL